MKKRLLVTAAVLTATCGIMSAQPRRASMMGGGGSDRGKCTIEVVVDGTAEVEIRGDNGNLRNFGGNPPQWRRFECTGPLPNNPSDFRFAGVDGRGRQTLIRDPRQGGAAVVRIEDKDGGSEGYTFDLFWGNDGYSGNRRGDQYPQGPPPPPPNRGGDFRGGDRGGDDGYYRDRDNWFRGEGWRRNLFQRVREDVEHARRVTFPMGGDQFRLGRTVQELNELQRKLSMGRYDERQLDDVIAALQRVVRDNRLSRRDRDVLADDLERMRDFRARHDYYGARDRR